jgi:hypothetical protein
MFANVISWAWRLHSTIYKPRHYTSSLFTTRDGYHSDLKLSSRTDTTLSVTLPPQTDFSSVVPIVHTLTPQQILEDLGVSQNDGLSKNKAARHLESCRENLLQGKVSASAWRVLRPALYAFIIPLHPCRQ